MEEATKNASIKEKVAEKREKFDEVSKEKLTRKNVKEPIDTYISRVPYLERLKRAYTDSDFSKFSKILKSLHFNIPFVDTH